MKVLMEFGVFAPTFRKQIGTQGLRVKRGMAKELAQCQKDSEAISRLTIRQVLTDSQREAARKKLMRKIVGCCALKKSEVSL